MRFASPSKVLVASLCAAGVQAAPAIDQLVYNSPAPSGLEALTFGLSSKLSSAFNNVLSHVSRPAAATYEDEGKTIWEVINADEEFKQLAHVLNYSSDATKDILKKKQNLTFFAPLNWHHHRDGGDDDKDAFSDLSFGPASMQEWGRIQKQIADYERDYSAESSDHDDDDDDKEKKRRRELIRHLIDAAALYHLVRSDTVLDAKAIADNSSVATLLNTGKSHANNDGTDWRVRTGKSLLPLPAVYLNFYSRIVKPDIRTSNGIIHAIKYPLMLPPDVLQALFFGQTTFSTSTSGLQKVHAAKYLTYRPWHSHHGHRQHHGHEHDGKHAISAWHHETNGTFNGVPAETVFVPSNLAWSRLPFVFRAYLFSPWGYHLLQKVFMLHSLPSDIVYADFVHHVKHSGKAAPEAVHTTVEGGRANKTSYTFDTVLPAIHGKKGEFETLDVDVYRYYLLPGGKGPLQTRMVVQNVSIILQDIPASNGVFHTIDRILKPKGHPEKGIWAEVAAAAEEAGFGTVDLHAEAQADLW
ncbi:FAS1 domain protein [Kalmanozyma brasiliensis GHG001]|uniref:FAS1 domain-containing protein n=1 Tax=Kalmanozyma brasiliensis (strain GHG001) TaxID=1365824 RepID=V5EQF0_KALBG|nr:FAS1 domain protein [Kalmanozyma brasiliensis GHG001]EST05158.1 FAS1 domain protein [Kalmanozyma brasiliensis GHG001]